MAAVIPGTDPVDVLIKRLDPGLPLPARSHPGDAGTDLVTAVDVELGPGERAVVPTGVAIALPDGYAAFVHPRSGLAAKHGVTIVNAPGTVDAGYRGEIRVTLLNTDAAEAVKFQRGDRIAQLVIQRVARPVFHEVDTLPGSARGEGGFGSTGGHAGGRRAGRHRPRPFLRRSRPEISKSREKHSVPSASPRGSNRARGRRGRGRRGPRAGGRGDLGRARGRGTWDGEEDGEAAVPAGEGEPAWGPWDAADEIPPLNRVDFGSLQVPVVDGFEIQLNIADDQGPLIAVVQGDSSLQVQAFAAPKTDGLWEDVRQEIAVAVAEAGGQTAEADGPFGPELHVRVPGEQPQLGLQPIRFLGVDGPRWFLRGVITGSAAEQPAAAAPFEEIFAGLVVVRGDHPAPPRDLLEITLPEEARKAMEEQMAAAGEDERFGEPLNPFERGPEITETR